MGSVVIPDFSGGLNTRDDPSKLALNETPDALNWTLDKGGIVRLRRGFTNVMTLPGDSGTPAYIFYSEALDLWLCARQNGANMGLWKRPGDYSGSWSLVSASISSGALGTTSSTVVSFADWPGSTPYCMIAVPSRGVSAGCVMSYDGTTLTQKVGSNQVIAAGIAVWQNRVWAIGYNLADANGNPARLFYSKLGDPLNWTVTGVATDAGFTDIRDKDAQLLTGVGVAGGSLVVFKEKSAYRVTDGIAASYAIIDSANGTRGPQGVVALRGRLYTWGADNLYEWDGVGAGKPIGDKARDTFATDPAIVAGVPNMAAGVIEDRLLFTFPFSAGATNLGIMEVDPRRKWLMRHQLASSYVSSFGRRKGLTLAAIPGRDAVHQVFGNEPGTDEGTAYGGWYSTPWIDVAGGRYGRLQRLHIEGLLEQSMSNSLVVTTYKDWDVTQRDQFTLDSDLRATTFNERAKRSMIQALGHARSFRLYFSVANSGPGQMSLQRLELVIDPIEAD